MLTNPLPAGGPGPLLLPGGIAMPLLQEVTLSCHWGGAWIPGELLLNQDLEMPAQPVPGSALQWWPPRWPEPAWKRRTESPALPG